MVCVDILPLCCLLNSLRDVQLSSNFDAMTADLQDLAGFTGDAEALLP